MANNQLKYYYKNPEKNPRTLILQTITKVIQIIPETTQPKIYNTISINIGKTNSKKSKVNYKLTKFIYIQEICSIAHTFHEHKNIIK